MVLRSLVLSLVVLSLSACNISGSGQKGPFKAGSTVTLSKLDSQANPITNKTKDTLVQGSQGRFSTNKINWNGWTGVEVNGEYFNEFDNTNSSGSLTLEAISKKNRTFDVINVHLFSHLAAARIKQRVANGESINTAWKGTQTEMAQVFGLSKVNRNTHRGVEQLSLTQGSGRFKQDNANLLLFTGAFLANGGDAASLQALSDDFSDDAQFNNVGADIFSAIALAGASDSLLETLSQNLKNHGAYNPPNNADLPELPVWVNDDGEVTDTVAPIISIGSTSVNFIVGTTFNDDVSATDNVDGNITANIVLGGDTVDTNTIGNYEITYNVSDSAGNPAIEVIRTVTVAPIPDTTAPIISVGSTDIEIVQGTAFVEDVTANDNIDGDITSNIVISGDTVNIDVVGVYNITYNVSDAAGNIAASVDRKITVILPADTIAPEITLTSPQDTTVEVNSTYTDSGATANDDRDGVVAIQTDLSNVNTSTIDNTFDVIYTATDAATNTSTATRTVTIVDTTPPVITIEGGDITITKGTPYQDAGVTTTDNSNLAVTVDTNNPVDINTPAIYTVTYTATDTKGNNSIATRTVTVEEDTTVPTTEISGTVKTLDGTPIPDANITVYKDDVIHSQAPLLSDNLGNYSLNLESNSNYTLVIELFGYATQVQVINNLTGASLALDFAMIANNTTLQIDPTIAFTGSDNDSGASVALDANDFDGVDTLQLTITPLDTSILEELNVIPGDINNPFTLFFLGLAEFTFTNETTNEVVSLAAGQTAEITIPIYRNTKSDGSAYAVGDNVQLYYLSEDTGIWIQEGTATVIAEANSPTGFAAKGNVSHFSWWALSYPSNPAIAGSYASEDLTWDTVLSSDGQIAYVADNSAGIKILNISNHSSIALLGSFNTASLFYSHVRLSSDESKLFALSTNAAATIIQIEILDISNPSNIISLVTIPVSGFTTFEVSSDDTKIFIASRDHKFEVIDITTPSNPTLLSSIDSVSTLGHVSDIAISTDGNTAFIAYRADGLVIVDLTNLNNISVISKTSAGSAMGIAISSDSNRAYVTDLYNKLRIFDTSNPSNPTELGIVNLTDYGRDVVISSTEAYAYVASWESGLQVIDISNSTNPTLIGNVNTIGRSINLAISLDDKHVYISDWEGGLQIIDTEKALLGDSIPPTITLNGSSYINQPLGTPYVELGATAVDDIDGVVTVAITGTVDVSVLGSFHEVTYTATDSSGNESTTHRTIYIVPGPEIGHTVIDAVSGLEIQDNEAVTSSMGRTWSEAIYYCENLVLNNLDDWRLPNETDSNDIITRGYDHAFSGNQIENHYGWKLGVGFTGAPNRSQYWNSLEVNTDTTKAYSIWNDDGVFGFSESKSSLMGTRCVRN